VTHFLIRRLLLTIPVLLGVATLVFSKSCGLYGLAALARGVSRARSCVTRFATADT
jgi:hypothetical protein